MSVETLISNALSRVNFRLNSASEKAAATLNAYKPGSVELKYNLDVAPGEKPSFSSAIGAVTSATNPEESEGGEELDIQDLSAESRESIAAIQNDYVGIATGMLDDIVGAYTVDVGPLLEAISTASFIPTMAGEIGKGESINKRARIAVMDAAAQRGFTHMPGQVVADIVAAQLNEYGVGEARSVVGSINATKIAAFSAQIDALSDALSAMISGKGRVLSAAASYAASIARATEVAVDETFAIAQAAQEYKKLDAKIKIRKASERDDLVSAMTSASRAEANYELSVRQLELAMVKAGIKFTAADYSQYSAQQKTTVDAGIDAVEWLGKIAAAAEAAANVVVSSSVTAFE